MKGGLPLFTKTVRNWPCAHSLCLRFNGHFFPGEPGLADTTTSPLWVILELKMMEAVVTVGAARRTKLPVKFFTTNKPIPNFYRPDALPVAQPTVSEH